MSYSPKLQYHNPFLWYTHLDLQALQELCASLPATIWQRGKLWGARGTLIALPPSLPSTRIFLATDFRQDLRLIITEFGCVKSFPDSRNL